MTPLQRFFASLTLTLVMGFIFSVLYDADLPTGIYFPLNILLGYLWMTAILNLPRRR
jgi:hypothetical protein